MNTILLLLCISWISLPCLARPVSYAGGKTLMQSHNNLFDSIHVHYSPSAKYSLGYRFDLLRNKPAFGHSVQLNNLLFRKNSKQYQANFYLKSGLGLIHDNSELDFLLYSGLATDWETRRFYASYSNRFIWGGDVFNLINNRWRLGFAPYVANYGDLHTWFMVQFDQNSLNGEDFLITPLIRFFKSNYLLELGYTLGADEGNVLANFTWRL